MAIKPASYLLASAVEGSADAFAETTIVTGLSLIGNLCYQLRGIWWNHTTLKAVDATALYLSLTRRTKTAIANMTDPDCIWILRTNVELATSGAFATPFAGYYSFADNPTYIVEDNLYLQIDSDATTVVNSANIRLEYDIVRITDSERNSLLSRTVLTSVST